MHRAAQLLIRCSVPELSPPSGATSLRLSRDSRNPPPEAPRFRALTPQRTRVRFPRPISPGPLGSRSHLYRSQVYQLARELLQFQDSTSPGRRRPRGSDRDQVPWLQVISLCSGAPTAQLATSSAVLVGLPPLSREVREAEHQRRSAGDGAGLQAGAGRGVGLD